jgi:hypothetical protein
MTRPDPRPLLILITAGPRAYREYMLRSLSGRYRLHLITSVEPGWELPYLAGASVLPSTDADAVRAAARRVADSQPVAGVMSWGEEHLVQSALAAEDLNLPGSRAPAVLRCRDKFATRSALAAHGVAQPAFVLVGDVDGALAAAEKLGYPVVLKPRAAAASEGVVLVRDVAELVDEFSITQKVELHYSPKFDDVVLLEEYLTGPEISVDAAVYGGVVTPVFLARKEIGFAPYFEETGHQVSGADPLLSDPELGRILTDVHAAIGYTDGWTHTELKLTERGPKVIEVNGRLGGDLIPYLGTLAFGIEPALAAAAIACGDKPSLVPSAERVAGVRFFYPPRNDSVIESVDFDRTALPAELDLLVPLVDPGDVVSPPRRGLIDGRVAFAIAVADTSRAMRSALDHAQGALRLRVGE